MHKVRNTDDSLSGKSVIGRDRGNLSLYWDSGNLGIVPPIPADAANIAPPKGPATKKAAPEKVMQAFNTWSFKREQPDNPELMLEIISGAVALGEPVPFVLYWGKGPRCRIDEPDVTCLDFLAALARRVREVHGPGAAMSLLFTDTHAELNGHARESTREYFSAVWRSARERGFAGRLLSDLTRAAEAAGLGDQIENDVAPDTLQRLSACAAKWYRGDGTPEAAALKYYQMNMVEKRAVELAFPRAIFVTFNGSEFRCLFPERLPIFYMYSLRRGVAVKPWFLPPVAPVPSAESEIGRASCRERV